MKNLHQAKSGILRVLICSQRDLRPELTATLIGREGIEVYRVEKFSDARLVGSSLGVQVILVDRDFPNAANFIQKLRLEPATRDRSIAVLTRGFRRGSDEEMLAAGANAVLRLPPDSEWDDRFTRLLSVPVRQQARMLVHIDVSTEPEYPAAIINLSPGGMFLATHRALHQGDELMFRFSLPDRTMIVGRGRVAREALPMGYGVEFLDLDGEGKQAVMSFLRSARLE
ncbi:MAG: PilZ domain-containing protein [Vicinamibacteria bacterium]